MSATIATANNQYIDNLERAFATSAGSVEWLAIVHDDPVLRRALTAALPDKSAVMLNVLQDMWHFDEGELREALAWVLEQGQVKNILLAGHSAATQAARLAALDSNNDNSTQTSGFEELIAGAGRRNAESQAARSEFAYQVEELSQLTVISGSTDAPGVCGLLYCGESGLFLVYDAEDKRYRPLLS